jgi:adenine nucleotide transporter 17
MSQSTVEQQKRAAATSAAVQQSDNIAHALAGSGGGILSMVLTYVAPNSGACRVVGREAHLI